MLNIVKALHKYCIHLHLHITQLSKISIAVLVDIETSYPHTVIDPAEIVRLSGILQTL